MKFTHLKNLIGHKPWKINNGWCFVWALYAREEIPFAQLFTYLPHGGHAFVKIKDKYYDAESPLGVTHWKKLKFFRDILQKNLKCSEKSIKKQNIYQFCKFWAMEGAAPLPDKYKKYWDD